MNPTNAESWPVSWHLLSHRLLWRKAIRITLLSTTLKCPGGTEAREWAVGLLLGYVASFRAEVMKEFSE